MEWISVEDRLPEDCIDKSKDIKQIKVLVAIKAKNGWTVRTQNRCKNTHYEYFRDEPEVTWYWRHSAGEVTHWMPLPEPPQGKPEECRYYTVRTYDRRGGCLGTKEIDPCEGSSCPRWRPKKGTT